MSSSSLSTQFKVYPNVHPFDSTVALDGISIAKFSPLSNGYVLVYNSVQNQWQPQLVTTNFGTANNVFDGYQAGTSITTGQDNTGLGYTSSTGLNASNNTAIGYQSLKVATSATQNVAIGNSPLLALTTGVRNTAVGNGSLSALTTGGFNVAIGTTSGVLATTATTNVAIGKSALDGLVSGTNNVCLGQTAGLNYSGAESGNIVIGQRGGAVGETSVIRIGNSVAPASAACFIQGINGVNVAGSVNVLINPSGQLGTVLSSRRYKKNITDAKDYYSSIISLLKVRNFRYRTDEIGYRDTKGVNEINELGVIKGPLKVGLIAEEVEEILPELVVYDKVYDNVKLPETIKYHEFIPIILQCVQQIDKEINRRRNIRRINKMKKNAKRLSAESSSSSSSLATSNRR